MWVWSDGREVGWRLIKKGLARGWSGGDVLDFDFGFEGDAVLCGGELEVFWEGFVVEAACDFVPA